MWGVFSLWGFQQWAPLSSQWTVCVSSMTTLPFIPTSSKVIGLTAYMTLYVTWSGFPVNVHEDKAEAVKSIDPLLIHCRSVVALSPTVSESLNGRWVIPLISMFPCFHIVYGWCKLLVCSLIALICSFHMASSDLDALVGKKPCWNGCWLYFKKIQPDLQGSVTLLIPMLYYN